MPLRDALRGVATLADATEDALEPATKLLPEALQSQFRAALESIEQAGKRLITTPIDTDDILTASKFFTASDTDPQSCTACAQVIVYAWDHLHAASSDHRHMISETIVADRLARASEAHQMRGAEFAANLITEIRNSSAVGRMPGLARGITAEDETRLDPAFLSIAIWLLSGRATTMAEEEKVLDLSLALVRALHTDALDLFHDRVLLTRFLADTATHL
jgi:hypothetical protein